ncbi:hypothetical protein [Intrasporangium chromatireducens]|nr:hypothetical protein [Intrasporangium chromatireducens]
MVEPANCRCGRHAKTSPHLWSVYVLEVEGTGGDVYVGCTWHSPEVRRQQHIDGPKKGRVFKKAGNSVGALRPDLVTDLEPLTNFALAQSAETYLAEILRSKGFTFTAVTEPTSSVSETMWPPRASIVLTL